LGSYAIQSKNTRSHNLLRMAHPKMVANNIIENEIPIRRLHDLILNMRSDQAWRNAVVSQIGLRAS